MLASIIASTVPFLIGYNAYTGISELINIQQGYFSKEAFIGSIGILSAAGLFFLSRKSASETNVYEAPADAYNLAYNQGFDDGRSQRKISKTVFTPAKAYVEDEKLFEETYTRWPKK